MKLKNLSNETKFVFDAGDGRGREVLAGELGDFTEQAGRELLAAPLDWAIPQTSAATSKEGES